MLETFHLPSFTKLAISTRLDEISADVHVLAGYKTALTPSQMRALVEVTHGIGVHHVQNMGTFDLIVLGIRPKTNSLQFSLQHKIPLASCSCLKQTSRKVTGNHRQLLWLDNGHFR